MRALALAFALIPLAAAAAESPDALEIAQRLAANGGAQLALARLEQSQPAQASAPRWSEWELLRIRLLAQLDRPDELLKRLAALPPTGVSDAAMRDMLLQGARAALKTSQGKLAREYAARTLWRYDVNPTDARELRLIAIESYFTDGQRDEAYRSMLRFQQDYQPLDRPLATRFVEMLLGAGMDKETVNWLAQVDEASPLRVLLRLKSGLTSPDAAIAQARALLAKSNTAGGWNVLLTAAQAQRNPVLQIEAQENLVALSEDGNAREIAARAAELWRLYQSAAQELGNRNQLLLGDDAGWSDFASRQLGANAPASRAMFAYLAAQGKTRETRFGAQLQLVVSLTQTRLALTALRLFVDPSRFLVQNIDPQARYQLGIIAADNRDYYQAVRFWLGLAAPGTVSADEWQAQLVTALFRAQMIDAGSANARKLFEGRTSMPPALVERLFALGQELLDGWHFKVAEDLFAALLPLADTIKRRDILFALGRAAEFRADYRAAADYFLQSATLLADRATDAAAQNARMLSASNMAKAGLRDDARAQYQWLLKNTKDAALAESVRREMKKL